MTRKCAHAHEEEVTGWSDPDRVFICLHCHNERHEPYDHTCSFICWAKHHPQKFLEDE